MTNLGIYVQVPFCQTRCTYCNFHTGVVSSSRFAPYVAAVCREIEAHEKFYAAHGVELPAEVKRATVDTVYIGGGTPSLLDPAHLLRILDSIRGTFACEFSEVTLEADPETITAEKAQAWVHAGIDRISFGVQSFCDPELVAAGRMHRNADVVPCGGDFARSRHREYFVRSDCRVAVADTGELGEFAAGGSGARPEHVSVYILEVDEKSRLGAELLSGGKRYNAGSVPSEDQMAEFYELAQSELGRGRLSPLRNFELGQAGLRVEAQFEILAARTVLGIWRGRAFVFRDAAMGQRA